MDLSLDEQKLLADFRRLDPAGRKEVLAYAAGRAQATHTPAAESTANQCGVEKGEPRPEAAKEPVFTE